MNKITDYDQLESSQYKQSSEFLVKELFENAVKTGYYSNKFGGNDVYSADYFASYPQTIKSSI